MKLDIRDIDKAKLLVALFENAKYSAWTRAQVANSKCPVLTGAYVPFVGEDIKQLQLSIEKAQSLLNENSYVRNTGPVFIGIDFSTREIDVSEYDKINNKDNKYGVELAEFIISSLRLNSNTPTMVL